MRRAGKEWYVVGQKLREKRRRAGLSKTGEDMTIHMNLLSDELHLLALA